ncbi:MAG: hypothetical protein AUH92_05880 [Acidobacteria bacterium 13_1_40CM_4_69_4]|nr:MAG: hypothetical protein AUH92_05880 [Acidobacteria bacterium 13_1_40CM_4_69_4]
MDGETAVAGQGDLLLLEDRVRADRRERLLQRARQGRIRPGEQKDQRRGAGSGERVGSSHGRQHVTASAAARLEADSTLGTSGDDGAQEEIAVLRGAHLPGEDGEQQNSRSDGRPDRLHAPSLTSVAENIWHKSLQVKDLGVRAAPPERALPDAKS